jgi:hypothetical protein
MPSSACSEEIDAEVWPMVMFLWGMGFKTFISCGGHKEAYQGRNDKTSYGKFYVDFFGNETMSIDDFRSFVSEKAGNATSLQVRHKCKGSIMARFSGKIKDFHAVFGNG